MTQTRDDVIRLVKEGNTAVAWITTKGAVVHVPTQPTVCIESVDASFFDDPAFPKPVLVISGTKGLSAVDPEWDGRDLFTCSNPECKQTHNSDWTTHDNLWRIDNEGMDTRQGRQAEIDQR